METKSLEESVEKAVVNVKNYGHFRFVRSNYYLDDELIGSVVLSGKYFREARIDIIFRELEKLEVAYNGEVEDRKPRIEFLEELNYHDIEL